MLCTVAAAAAAVFTAPLRPTRVLDKTPTCSLGAGLRLRSKSSAAALWRGAG